MPLFVFTRRMLGRDPVFVKGRGGQMRAMIDSLEIGGIARSATQPGRWDWTIHCYLNSAEALDLSGTAESADLACLGLSDALQAWVRDSATLTIRSVPIPLRRPSRPPRLPR